MPSARRAGAFTTPRRGTRPAHPRWGGAAVCLRIVFDAGYDPIALTADLADLAVMMLVRIRSDHGTVIRVQVEHLPRPTARALQTLWLWWAGPGTPDLELCWRTYIRRFDLEHTFRFCQQALGWAGPPRGCALPSRPTAGPGW